MRKVIILALAGGRTTKCL